MWLLRERISLMHQSIPPAPTPPGLLQGICPPPQSRGWGICKFFIARGLGICQPRAIPELSNTHAVSYQNVTTQRVLLEKKSRLAHLSRTGINWRELLRHVLDLMHAFLHCLSSQNYYLAKLELSMWINDFWLLNHIFFWYYLKNILSYL